MAGNPSDDRHDIRQPLFAIALAAQNGVLMLESGNPALQAKALAKFRIILDQVDIARDIVDRGEG